MKKGIVIESNKDYHGYMDAVSKSRLAKMSVCPQYFKWCEENPQEPTEDLVFGSAFHKIVLEPEDFNKEFAVMPMIDRRTKAGKQEYLDFLEANQDKQVITQEQYDLAVDMANAIKQNKYAMALLEGNKEESIYYTDELTGIACKIRPDVRKTLNNGGIVITDLKSCKSAVAEDFMRDIVKYSYDLQSYMYSNGTAQALSVPMENITFVFVAVEKKAPHLTAIYEVNADILNRGEMLYRKYLGQLKYCTDNNNWYGYNGFTGAPMTIGLPDYLKNNNNKGE